VIWALVIFLVIDDNTITRLHLVLTIVGTIGHFAQVWFSVTVDYTTLGMPYDVSDKFLSIHTIEFLVQEHISDVGWNNGAISIVSYVLLLKRLKVRHGLSSKQRVITAVRPAAGGDLYGQVKIFVHDTSTTRRAAGWCISTRYRAM